MYKLSALLVLVGLSTVESHSTKIRHCVLEDGNLRAFVEHWHGALRNLNGVGTMTFTVNGQEQTLLPAGIVNNIAATSTNFPGCQGKVTTQDAQCGSRPHNKWVYYDFPASCATGVEIKMLAGNTEVLQEGCYNLFPATIAISASECEEIKSKLPEVPQVPAKLLDGYKIACKGAVSTGAASNVTGNVVAGGAFSTGYHSYFRGNADAVGAATTGAMSKVTGNLLSQELIAIGAGTGASLTNTGDMTAVGDISVGAGATVVGNVNSPKTFKLGDQAHLQGTIKQGSTSTSVPASKSEQAVKDVKAEFATLMSRVAVSTLDSARDGGTSVPPGVYRHGTATLPGTVTFNGTAQDTWIVQVGNALAFHGHMHLTGGATPKNVFWVVDGAVTVNVGSVFSGTVFATGAINLAAQATFTGSLYSSGGACNAGVGATIN